MWRMLLVDDEVLEREAIQTLIKQSNLPIEIIAEAENGRKAIELTDVFRPDIIMIDIKMPGINGIDAIKELKDRHPYTKFIIVSAYDYFSYAQEAMSLGVKYYLLKPAKKQQIFETITKVIEEIEREQRERQKGLDLKEKLNRIKPVLENEMTKSFLLNQINDYDRKELIQLLDLNFHKGFSMILTFDNNGLESINYEQIKNKIKQLSQCLISPLINNQIILFVIDEERTYQHETNNYLKTSAFSLARKIKNQLKIKLRTNCNIAIGGEYSNLDELHLSYQQALLASKKVNFKNPIVHYEDIVKEIVNVEIKYSIDLEKHLMEAVRLLDEKRVIYLFRNFFKEMKDQSVNIDEVRDMLTELFTIITRVGIDLGYLVNEFPTFTAFEKANNSDRLQEIAIVKIKQFFLIIEEKRRINNIPLIEKAKAYIYENFDKDITLEIVANYVQLSPYYVSKLFKETYGFTFKDYITKLRIEKAKELMSRTEMSNKEICYQVGYNDPNYFSRVFKKTTGNSPSEYKIEKGSIN